MASFAESATSRSRSRKPTHHSFVDRSRSLRFAVVGRITTGFSWYTHRAEHSSRVDFVRSYGRRPALRRKRFCSALPIRRKYYQLLQKFWEDEEVFQRLPLTEEEEQCERHFKTTHSRTPQGRYIVRLPFKEGPPVELGESLPIAIFLYNRTENRLSRLPELYVQYNNFLREYQALGHINVVKDTDKSTYLPVYLPHHAVLKATSHTTKLRVVFNASCKTCDGTSLNDKLLTGPKLQSDLAAIILCWRQWRYVYTADIAKMFRQILVDPRDADFQRILWRRPKTPQWNIFASSRLLTDSLPRPI